MTTLKESLQTGAMQTAWLKMPENLVAWNESFQQARKK
jgi:hypothetical protein